MLGAIVGDIVGSRFEFNNHRSKNFDFFADGCFVTDDGIMTLAVAKAIMECADSRFDESLLSHNAVKYMQEIGRKYPDCGFGRMLNNWIFSDDPRPYNSFGNGAAMRVSPCGFIAETEDEAKFLSKIVTEVTHNHPEGLKGAEAVAVAVYMAKTGSTKKEIRERIDNDYYPLDFTLNGIRTTYRFNETCRETVPQAIVAFLEAVTFEDAVRNAVSIGGDSDTLAAVTGSIAEAYYGIDRSLEKAAMKFLDAELRGIYAAWKKYVKSVYQPQKLKFITKYTGKTTDPGMAYSFEAEFYVFLKMNDEYGLKQYVDILKKNGLEWKEASLRNADVSKLDEIAVLALVTAVLRADHFSNGIFETFAREGILEKWLVRLKEIDDAREAEQERADVVAFRIDVERDIHKESLEISAKELFIREHHDSFGDITHHYTFNGTLQVDAVEQILEEAGKALAAEGWLETDEKSPHGTYRYTLVASRSDETTVRRRGNYDRVHIPEEPWGKVISAVRGFLGLFMFGEIVNMSGFMNAMRVGEVKYCGVEVSKGGKIYHYRTTDLRIAVGDRVIVPAGDNNYEREAVVKTVEFCRWDDTPYPLEKTKRILGKADYKIHNTPKLALPGEVVGEEDDDADDEGAYNT
ncbi:MAG: ADP-ribosylglycohydrolase family protein [Desulfovibrio sp.]|jgi:ADP-ribosylglycohydrolase|nr:ADP-ribosylglycohydrolase family protein [Desulfovibrio sp.]